jgi:hypothetical protein
MNQLSQTSTLTNLNGQPAPKALQKSILQSSQLFCSDDIYININESTGNKDQRENYR